jgi:Tol biopolymer transport system component
MRQTWLSTGDVYCQALFVVRPDGSGLHRLSSCPNPSVSYWTSPSWSPDRKKIAFAHCRDVSGTPGCYELYVMNADGSHVRRLTYNHLYDDHPAWSPDGKRLVFTRGSVDAATGALRNLDLWVINSDGSHPHPLIRDRWLESNPVWSPSGGLIAFLRHRPAYRTVSLAVIKPDGTKRRGVAAVDAAGGGLGEQLLLLRPTWSPDGRRLALAGQGGLEIVTLRGRLVRKYPVGGSDGRGFHPSWSADGKSIAFVRFEDTNSASLYVVTLSSGAVRPLTTVRFPLDDEQPDW